MNGEPAAFSTCQNLPLNSWTDIRATPTMHSMGEADREERRDLIIGTFRRWHYFPLRAADPESIVGRLDHVITASVETCEVAEGVAVLEEGGKRG